MLILTLALATLAALLFGLGVYINNVRATTRDVTGAAIAIVIAFALAAGAALSGLAWLIGLAAQVIA